LALRLEKYFTFYNTNKNHNNNQYYAYIYKLQIPNLPSNEEFTA